MSTGQFIWIFIFGFVSCMLLNYLVGRFSAKHNPLVDMEAYQRGLKDGLRKANDPALSEMYIEMKRRADMFHRRAQVAEGLIEGFVQRVSDMLKFREKYPVGDDARSTCSWLRYTKQELEKEFKKDLERHRRKGIHLAVIQNTDEIKRRVSTHRGGTLEEKNYTGESNDQIRTT